jgi:hypothetical protein
MKKISGVIGLSSLLLTATAASWATSVKPQEYKDAKIEKVTCNKENERYVMSVSIDYLYEEMQQGDPDAKPEKLSMRQKITLIKSAAYEVEMQAGDPEGPIEKLVADSEATTKLKKQCSALQKAAKTHPERRYTMYGAGFVSPGLLDYIEGFETAD